MPGLAQPRRNAYDPGNKADMRLGAIIILWMLSALNSRADLIYYCDVCEKQIQRGTIWTYKQPKLTNYVCDICYKLPYHCSICSLPAGDGHIKLGDGRVICRKDAGKVILVEDEAVRVFWEARRDVERIAEGNMGLRSQNLTVRLFDSPFWASKKVNPDANEMHLLGIAASPFTSGDFFHNVNLLNGVERGSLAATSAHEYTHLWINENRPDSHKIDGDTMEAICELVAFKLAAFRQDSGQMEKIKSNAYTKGKILGLIEYEREFGFQAVLQWVKTGTAETLATKEVAKTAPRMETPFFVPASAVSAAPAVLLLKGLLGSGQRRLALINDRTFEKSESGKVRVGDKSVLVKCVDILADSVVVQVDGAGPVTLTLEGK